MECEAVILISGFFLLSSPFLGYYWIVLLITLLLSFSCLTDYWLLLVSYTIRDQQRSVICRLISRSE